MYELVAFIINSILLDIVNCLVSFKDIAAIKSTSKSFSSFSQESNIETLIVNFNKKLSRLNRDVLKKYSDLNIRELIKILLAVGKEELLAEYFNTGLEFY